MSESQESSKGSALGEQSEEPTSLRSPQARNLLQFSTFAGIEESPPCSRGRFRRVMTTVSGSNGPMHLTNLTSRQLSQMSSSDSGEAAGPSTVPVKKDATPSVNGEQEHTNQDSTKNEKIMKGQSSIANGNIATSSKEDSVPHRAVIQGLTKKVSHDGKVIRKISGLLSLTNPISRRSSQPELRSQTDLKLGADNGASAEDLGARVGKPMRAGSFLRIFGRKEKLPQRKRPFLRVSKRTGRRTQSEDFQIETVAACEMNVGQVEDDISCTEDDFAKRAVHIEKFLNDVAFL